MLRVSKPFRWASAAFLDPITASRAHFLNFAVTRARSREASTFICDPASSQRRGAYETKDRRAESWLGCGEKRGLWAARPRISSRNQQTYGIGHCCTGHVPYLSAPPTVCPARKLRTSGPALRTQNHRLSCGVWTSSGTLEAGLSLLTTWRTAGIARGSRPALAQADEQQPFLLVSCLERLSLPPNHCSRHWDGACGISGERDQLPRPKRCRLAHHIESSGHVPRPRSIFVRPDVPDAMPEHSLVIRL